MYRDGHDHFYRDNHGNEIDAIVEYEGRLSAMELKSGMTPAGDWFRALHRFSDLAGPLESMIVYGGDESFRRENVHVHGWRDLPEALSAALD